MPALSAALHQAFAQAANPELAGPMAAYMKDLFPFFGIPAPERRSIQRPFYQQYLGLARKERDQVLEGLWKLPERECQYAACDWMRKEAKTLPKGFADRVEDWVCRKSWWDTVDGLAVHVLGSYLLRFPDESEARLQHWMRGGNLWLQRCAILHQLTYGRATNTDRLYGTVLVFSDSKAFFLQKAMGWALREYAKTDPVGVRNWLEGNEVPALTRREALEHVVKKD